MRYLPFEIMAPTRKKESTATLEDDIANMLVLVFHVQLSLVC